MIDAPADIVSAIGTVEARYLQRGTPAAWVGFRHVASHAMHQAEASSPMLCSSKHKAWCASACSTQGRALKVPCADTGFGNRLLNLLTPSVYARVLHRHVITFWATPGNIDGRRHMGMRFYGSLSELRALVMLPSELQFIEDWTAAQRHGNSSSKV